VSCFFFFMLGYWDIHRLAHTIYLLLEYTETPYQEWQCKARPAPNFNQSNWTNEKEKLGLDFPNLNAIMCYIAHKPNMCGETEAEELHVDMLENHLMDLCVVFIMLCYKPDFEKLKTECLEQLPGKLWQLLCFLGSELWFVDDKLTLIFVDFLAYDMLDQHHMFALEKNSAYMHLGCFMKIPVSWCTALWRNKKE
uniref:glutathione transferase n=1 Tax=Coturnix japonica TaxID=93934 RepID=A0A8C2SVM7_COTJA